MQYSYSCTHVTAKEKKHKYTKREQIFADVSALISHSVEETRGLLMRLPMHYQSLALNCGSVLIRVYVSTPLCGSRIYPASERVNIVVHRR